jgi:hypothetical protein
MGMFMCWIIIQTRGKQMSEGQMELAKFNKRVIKIFYDKSNQITKSNFVLYVENSSVDDFACN